VERAAQGEIAVAASDDVKVTLDRSVALVLFDFLARTADEEDGEPLAEALQHKAELPALWATLAALENVLPEPFEADYSAQIKAARAKVIARLGGAAPKSR
jgi:hypothetical protein